MDRLVLGGQRLAGAQLFQDVVHVGQGQFRMLGLLALAVRVQLLGEGSDVRLLRVGGRGEGEFAEAFGVVVVGIIADSQPGSRCPCPDT